MTRRKRLLLAALLPILALSVAGIAFAVTREVSPGGSARADTPEYGPTPPVGNQTPDALVAPEQTRAAEPKFDQIINGLHVGPGTQRRVTPCEGIPNDSKDIQNRPYSDSRSVALAGGLAIEPKYLPTGTTNDPTRDVAVLCAGTLAMTGRDFYVPADRNTGRYGGYLLVRRSLGEPFALVDLPARDFSPGTISGRMAVLVRPTTSDGFGDSAVVVADPQGVTVLYARGITLAELVNVAEGLY